jgi:hypothetical protein
MRIVLSLLLLLSPVVSAQELEISNFRSGLACTHSAIEEGPNGWICQPTEEILITDQGRCNYAGEDKLCTWVGFEFDYRNAGADDKLECTVETSRPVSLGSPNQPLGKESTVQHFSIALLPGSGHFYNPQYFTFTPMAEGEPLLVNNGRCSHNDQPVFEYVYRLRFPVLPPTEGGN